MSRVMLTAVHRRTRSAVVMRARVCVERLITLVRATRPDTRG